MNYASLNNKYILSSNPLLLERLSSVDSHSSDLELIPSSSGAITTRIRGKFLHSTRDPVKEAQRLIAAHMKSGTEYCILEGFGLGYYAKEALLYSDTLTIIVIDPSLERFKKALEAQDLSPVLTSSRVLLLIGEQARKISSVLTSLSPGKITRIRNRALYSIDTSFYKETEGYIARYTARKKVNEATLKRFGQIWIRNLIYNMNILSESGNLQDLEKLFSDIPVLLLAAGPSLTKTLPLLAELREKFVLVAVDTASKALKQYGINPDFLIVIDPQYWNTRHLDHIDLSKTILVSESATHPSVFRKKHGILYLSGSLFPLGQFMETYINPRKRLGAGGSVSTSAWDFCHLISTGPVYCAGLDLGFPDTQTHYKGSFFEERSHTLSTYLNSAEDQAFRALNGAHPFPLTNNTGGATLTDQRLIVYKQWFEERLEQSPERKTYNLSPKGIKIEGIPFVPLRELLSFPHKRKTIDNVIRKLSPPSRIDTERRKQNIFQGAKYLIEELEKLSSLTEKSIETINTFLQDPKELPYTEAVTILDTLDKEILNLKSKKISGFLIQPLLKDVISEKSTDPLLISKNLYAQIKESSN